MKNFVFVIALVLISASSFSQKVNFSGHWKLNSEKSELGDQFSLGPKSLIIEHKKKYIDFERNSEFQGQEYVTNDHFTLDGEVCENPGFMDSMKKSTATWDKKTKTMTINTSVEMDDGTEVDILEEIVLEEDKLVIESVVSSSYGELYERFVFDKE